MRTLQSLLCAFTIAYGLALFNTTQISPNQFFEHYINNTTHIDIYDQKKAYFFLNATHSKHFFIIPNSTNFEDSLHEHNYTNSILHKISKAPALLNYVFIAILFSVFAVGRGVMGIRKSIFLETKVQTRLSDVAGLEQQKQEIFEFVDFLKHRSKYIEAGARMPRGALFHGPPGTGKTLLAKAVAGECNISFLSVAGPDFSEMFVGVGSARVRDLFKKAREKAPCIVFIDEIDALARSRSKVSSTGQHEKENTLNSLLIELDGFNENDKILVFAATNRIDMLDKALLRPGRFDRKIQFELPERADRELIFKHYLSQKKLEEDVDVIAKSLSKQCFAFSSADIANICNEASILSVRADSNVITRNILERAVENVLLGHEKKTFRLSDKERKIVAYHESGHSLLSYILPNAKPPIKVSIMPRGKSALGFSQSELSENKLRTKEELLDQICVLLGGRAAEEEFCDSITTGASDDLVKATGLAYDYVSHYCLDDSFSLFHYDRRKSFYGQKIREKIDERVKVILFKNFQRAQNLIINHKLHIEKMTNVLLEKETMNEIDIKELFQDIKLCWEA